MIAEPNLWPKILDLLIQFSEVAAFRRGEGEKEEKQRKLETWGRVRGVCCLLCCGLGCVWVHGI